MKYDAMECHVNLLECCKIYHSFTANKLNLKDTSVTPVTYYIPYVKAPC